MVVDPGLAVAPVRRDSPRCPAGEGAHPLQRREEQGAVGGVADVQAVVDDDAVFVVHDLAEETELDRLTDPPFFDGACVGVVQADQAGRPFGDLPRQAEAGLGDHTFEPADQRVQRGDFGLRPARSGITGT